MPHRRKKTKLSWRGRIILMAAVAMAIVFLPTSFMLGIGMLPTFVALLIDRSRGKLKALTVGAMNLAGCLPFILELWVQGHNFQNAVMFMTQPRTIVVMYFSAAIGYMIEWAVSNITTSIVLERGKARIKEIEKIHEDMEEKWGKEVSGKLPLDQYGFPAEKPQAQENA